MTPEQKRALARFLRPVLKRAWADVPALTSLFETYVEEQRVPDNWREVWEAMQESANYQKVVQEVETLLFEIENAADVQQWGALFEKISRDKPPN